MKILVIEDNPDISYLLNYILEDEGHEVVSAPDGSTLSNLGTIQPDIILMDEMMAGPRGSELCKILKANEATRHIHVVLISAISQLSKTAANCGADAFIEKPFDIDTLNSVIKKFGQ